MYTAKLSLDNDTPDIRDIIKTTRKAKRKQPPTQTAPRTDGFLYAWNRMSHSRGEQHMSIAIAFGPEYGDGDGDNLDKTCVFSNLSAQTCCYTLRDYCC